MSRSSLYPFAVIALFALTPCCYRMSGTNREGDDGGTTDPDHPSENAPLDTEVENGFDFTAYETLLGSSFDRTFWGLIRDGGADRPCRYDNREFRLELATDGEMICFNAKSNQLTSCDNANTADIPLQGTLMVESGLTIPVKGNITLNPLPLLPEVDLELTYDTPFVRETFGDNLNKMGYEEEIGWNDIEQFVWEGVIDEYGDAPPEIERCLCIVDDSVEGTLPPPNW